MRVIEQSATILDWSGLDLYQRIETAARVCRRSESKGDAEGFVRSLIRKGHFPPLEFARIITGWEDAENIRRIRERAAGGGTLAKVWQSRLKVACPTLVEDIVCPRDEGGVTIANDWIPVLFVTSRTMSHQLVRYRHNISFCQESQRHCRYDRDGIEVIEPPGLNDDAREAWREACLQAENAYTYMIWRSGATAEQARAVLPGCTATRILAYASPQEWKHIFSQRVDSHADPQMYALVAPLQEDMKSRGLI